MEVDGESIGTNELNISKRVVTECVDLTEEKEGRGGQGEPMQTELHTTSGDEERESQEEEVKIINSDDDEYEREEPPKALSCKQKLADEYKGKGNECYKSKEYIKAVEMYSKAIALRQFEPAYYGNRCASYIMLGKYAEAQTDARKAVMLDSTFEKGYQRLFRSTLFLGDIAACDSLIVIINGLPKDVRIDVKTEFESYIRLKGLHVELEKDLLKKDYRKALFTINQALEIATADLNLIVKKADILYNLDRIEEASEVVLIALQKDNRLMEGWHVGAKCFYQQDLPDKTLIYLKRGLQFAPDSVILQGFYRRIKQLYDLRDKGRKFFTERKLEEAKRHYDDALNLLAMEGMRNPAIQSKLYYNLSLIARGKSVDESLGLCNKAIELNPKYLKAIGSRATLLISKGMYDEALRDYDAASKLEPTNKEWRRLIQETTFAAKKAKRKDYYKILGIERTASEIDIRKSYKKQCFAFHPDRHSSATTIEKKEQEDKFKEVQEAYQTLLDPKKRSRYDMGEDLNDPPSGFETFDASQIFNAFYTNFGGVPTGRPGQGYQHYRNHQQGPGRGCFNPR